MVSVQADSKTTRALLYAFNRGYRSTPDGNVVSPKGKTLRLFMNTGYLAFGVKAKQLGPHTRSIQVHRLIAYEKFGDAYLAGDQEGRHRDGNKHNNKHSNIVIGTASNNMMNIKSPVRNWRSLRSCLKTRKLTDKQVTSLRHDALKYTYKYLCQKYDLAKSTVSYIVNDKTYTVKRRQIGKKSAFIIVLFALLTPLLSL